MDTMETQPITSIGWGFLASLAATASVIGIAVATVLLAVGFGTVTLWSLTGLVIVLGLLGEAILATGLTLYATLAADAMVSYVSGRVLLRRVRPAWVGRRAMPLVVGLPIFVLLTMVPVLGQVIGLLAALAAFGAMWIHVRDRHAPVGQAVVVQPLRTPAAA